MDSVRKFSSKGLINNEEDNELSLENNLSERNFSLMDDTLSIPSILDNSKREDQSNNQMQRNTFQRAEEEEVYKDIVGSLAGMCLMIDENYKKLENDENYYKHIKKLSQEAGKENIKLLNDLSKSEIKTYTSFKDELFNNPYSILN